VRGTVGPRGRLAACTAPWPFQKVTGRRPRRRRQTRRLKPGGVPVELPRGVLENAGVFGVFGEPWFFGGGRCPCHSPPLGGYRGGGGDRRGAAGKANGRLAGGGRRGRGDPTTRRAGRAIPSALAVHCQTGTVRGDTARDDRSACVAPLGGPHTSPGESRPPLCQGLDVGSVSVPWGLSTSAARVRSHVPRRSGRAGR